MPENQEVNVQDLVQEIVSQAVDAGQSEDEIVMAVYQDTRFKVTVKEAIAEVRKAKIALGLEKTPAQRKAEFEDTVENLEGFDLSNADFVSEALTIAEDLGISVATARKYLEAWAKELDVTLAVAESKGRTPSNWPQVKDLFAGMSLEDVDALDKDAAIANIMKVEADPKKAHALFNRLRKELGATAGESKIDKLVAWFRDAYTNGKPTDRAAIVAAGVEAGMTTTSAQYYVNVFNITKGLLVDLAPSE